MSIKRTVLALVAVAGRIVTGFAGDGPTGPWEIRVAALPAVLYEDETVALTVTVANRGGTERECRLVLELEGAEPQVWRLALGSGREAVVVFTLRPSGSVQPRRGAWHATEHSPRDGGSPGPFWRWEFLLADVRGDFSDLRLEGLFLANRGGTPVILVNRREREAEHRRWAPVRRAVAAWNRGAAPRLVSGPAALLGLEASGGEQLLTMPGGRSMLLLPHDGDPLAACLAIGRGMPAGRPAVLALAWGHREAYDRFPVREFGRLLDVAIDRLRANHPRVQLVLATPPPLPGEAEAVNRYAEEIRRLAREHRAGLVDWHAAVLAVPGWERLYALPGGDGVTGLYPNAEGVLFLRDRLAEALW